MCQPASRFTTAHGTSSSAVAAVLTTLQFAMVDTLLVSLEVKSVRRWTLEVAKLFHRRLRR
ncbi:hypothetical protein ACVWWN_002379 [Mycobacterium sp. URHB0021]|jgi:hypothetical protein